MSVVSTTLRTLCSAMGVMLGSLYVGGHVQNDTFVDSYLGTVHAQIDPRAGQACVGEACDPQCLWWDHRTGNDTDTQCDSWALRRGPGRICDGDLRQVPDRGTCGADPPPTARYPR